MSYDYAKFTYDSKNPLARFAHRERFKTCIDLVRNLNFDSLLDYGAGDAEFLKRLKTRYVVETLDGYEPIMKTAKMRDVNIYKHLDDIIKKYELVVCFEVLEHFNEVGQVEILQNIINVLDPKGFVIISVPIEVGFPSLIKNIRRMTLGHFNLAYIKNTLKCLFKMEVPEIRRIEGFIPSHLGFNHSVFEKILTRFFDIRETRYSPFKFLSSAFNSQVCYVLSLRNE